MLTEPRTWAQTSSSALLLLGFLLVAREGDTASLEVVGPSFKLRGVSALRSEHLADEAPSTVSGARRESARVILDTVTVRPAANVLDGLSSSEILRLLVHHPERLGPASLGRPNRGGLFRGIQLQSSAGLRVLDPTRSFGTEATVTSLEVAASEVQQRYPSSPVLKVGDISRPRGGYLRPHRSHQSGRDVDLGYYYLNHAGWYTKATSENLDRERTWAFVKALIAQGTVEYIFMDRSVQGLLREHAERMGESAELLAQVFENRQQENTVFRHTRGHLTHFHVRFSDPAAEATGQRIAALLQRAGAAGGSQRVVRAAERAP